MTRFRFPPFLLMGATLLACNRPDDVELRFVLDTPHDRYLASLHTSGLAETALASDWIAAAERAVGAPVPVTLPHREVRWMDPTRASALGLSITLARGQRLVARIEPDNNADDPRVFLDLFFTGDTTSQPWLVHSGDPSERILEFVTTRPGTYVLRIQPELLRGGRLGITVSRHASLAFPVAERDMAAIRSGFGAARDGGRREHHGVDIFAPRGTPVLAATDGYVARVGTNRLGGNVIWLRDEVHGQSLYYAHLDRHAVTRGARVRSGDTLGYVGNTGNARTTPPHLHFGIYIRGTGPVDPHFHIFEPLESPAIFAGLPDLIGHTSRVAPRPVTLRPYPTARSGGLTDATPGAPVDVLAGIGNWYLVRLPDGLEGYVPVASVEPLDRPLGRAALALSSAVLTAPGDRGIAMDSLRPGLAVHVLGSFGDYSFIEGAGGLRGWVASHLLDAADASAGDGL